MTLEQTRTVFELTVYQRYFIMCVSSDLKLKEAPLSKAEFCERKENGDYADDSVQQAWLGWQWGVTYGRGNPHG